MSATILSPPPAPRSVVSPVKFTVDEFDQMGDMGWFEGRRAILIDGTILEQGPMNPPHANGIVLLQEALRGIFPTGWVVRSQLPLNIDGFNDPMPDFAVVPGVPQNYFGRHPSTASLIVEVSDSTLAFDMTEKAERYAGAGIADYWILDLNGRRLLVYRDPDSAAATYRQQQAYGPADRVAPLAAPGSSILVGDLLP